MQNSQIVLQLVAALEEVELLCAIVSNTVKGMIILLQAPLPWVCPGARSLLDNA
jgi:hypothetical protein